jgi:hypothetical protein
VPKKLSLIKLAAFFAASVICAPVWAQSAPVADPSYDRDVFFFAGRFQNLDFGHSFVPFNAPYNSDSVFGGGYQQFFSNWNGFKLGAEVGLAARFSNQVSAELWGGVVGRYDGWALGPVRISPALTFGLSAVSGYVTTEADQVPIIGKGVPILFYLGPELNFSLADHPNIEAFIRIQHRSGGYGTIAKIDAANADTLGLRWKF